jgi:hypothetical protein
MKRMLVIGSVALCALGCSRDKATDATPTTTPAPSAAVAAPASAAAAEAPGTTVSPQTVAAIPAEEDFEPQAATSITAANAAEQLAALEKEIKQP